MTAGVIKGTNDLQHIGDTAVDAWTQRCGAELLDDVEVGGARAVQDRRASFSVAELQGLSRPGVWVLHGATLRIQLYKDGSRAWNQIQFSGQGFEADPVARAEVPAPYRAPERGRNLEAILGARSQVPVVSRPGSHHTPVADVQVVPSGDTRWTIHPEITAHLVAKAKESLSQRVLIGKVCIRSQLWRDQTGHVWRQLHFYGAAAVPEVPRVFGVVNGDPMYLPSAMVESRRFG